MSASELLELLARRRVNVSVEGDRLRIDAPPGVFDEELRARVQASKPELMRLLADGDGMPFPLRDIQHAYWIGRTGAVPYGNTGCHMYAEFDSADLDLERLSLTWRALVERHDMLRAIVLPDGTQHVLDTVPPYAIDVLELRGASSADADAALARMREDGNERDFAPDRWPLFELRAARLDGWTRLAIGIDLLMLDATAIVSLLREWGQLYREVARPSRRLAYTFRRYVLDERAARDSERYDAARRYWLERLPLPGPPELPVAAYEPSARPRFARRTLRLAAAQWSILKERCRERSLTASAAVGTAYGDVLRRWSRRSSFSLTLTTFHREPFHPDAAHLAGEFTQPLVLDVATTAATFEGRAADLQRRLHEGLEHALFSGIEVMRAQRRLTGRDIDVQRFVFTSFLAARGDTDLGAAWAWLGSQVWGLSRTPQVWLDCQAFEEDGELVVNLDALEAVFRDGILDDLVLALSTLLARLAGRPAAWADKHAELLPARHAELLATVNATAVPFPSTTLAALVVERARAQPQDPALVAGELTFSYAELLATAAALAERLRAHGVRPNELVSVVMTHGWEQVVATLAVLLAGAAYLPVDATLPTAQIRLLLDDGEVSVAITQAALADGDWRAGVSLLVVDRDARADLTRAPHAAPDDLAYVIYTSGSTGHPKGVMISHAAAVNTILEVNRRFAVEAGDRVLFLSSLGFDLSVYDLFGTLAAGATIVVPDERARRDARELARIVADERVTVWSSVPAFMELLLEGRPARAATGHCLRLVMLSGDVVPVRLPSEVRRRFPGARVISLGGATEAAIWSIWYPTEELAEAAERVPYGRPLANQTMHVLDDRLEPRPLWVVGDLYIGGAGLARGYWRDPALTAARFIRHPCTGERLYATGDLGRWLPDGTIEFLGREDAQIKLRGHRIELGEIEAALEAHPAVRRAAVRVGTAPNGSRELEAYVLERVDPLPAAFWERAHRRARERADRLPDLTRIAAVERAANELSMRWLLACLREHGIGRAAGETVSSERLVSELGALPRFRPLLEAWLRALAADGYVEPLGDGYVTREPVPGPQRAWQLQASGAEETLLAYVDRCGRAVGQGLRGEVDPLRLLFPDGDFSTAFALYRSNPVAAHVNAIAAAFVGEGAEEDPGRVLRVLEVGAGVGGTTDALLASLPPDRTRYVFTDVSRFFLHAAATRLREHTFLEYGLLDIDGDLPMQGFAGRLFDVVVAANVLHDARDVAAALARLGELLVPHGRLVMIEATRHARWQLTTIGLIEGFTRPGETLLLPHEWHAALTAAGYGAVSVYPDPRDDLMPAHVIVATSPGRVRDKTVRAWPLEARELREHLQVRLPSYMVPARFAGVSELPLSANGKVDRSALPVLQPVDAGPASASVVPESAVQDALQAIWKDVLGVERVGLDVNFFEAGGDSLSIVKVQSMLAERLGTTLEVADLFAAATIRELARRIEQADVAAPVDDAAARSDARKAWAARRRERNPGEAR
jgi:amino acid adenylation domain-containing protein